LPTCPRLKEDTMQEHLVPEYVESREFSSSLRGYDKEEVDAFLSSLAAEIREYQRASSEQLYQNLGEEMGALLQHAKDSGDAMRKEAEEDAAATRHSAESDAQRTRAEAEQKASEIRAAANEEAAQKIKEAEDRVRELESMERDARERLRSLRAEVETVSARLSSLDTVEPAAGSEAGPQIRPVETAEVRLEEGHEAEIGSHNHPAH
jgi:cell division initiation protein